MERAILIDGNNLLFRSYYATAYTGSIMKNSKGFPTNAVYGFINMINKILKEENPKYILVAFDKGKNFRHRMYDNYKVGRIETPQDLLRQFPIAKEILTYLGIKYLEVDDYEADDIIGTFAKMADINNKYDATIISSDKDLLQLISDDVDVKLLKQKDYIKFNKKTFKEYYGFDPVYMVDLKALEGDKSDNIPGVKGIGEKTAITLIQKYNTIENMYNNIDEISGKLKEKLLNDKSSAFFSKELATIYKDIKLNISFEDLKKENINVEKLFNIYKELEFFSLIKNFNMPVEKEMLKIQDIAKLNTEEEFSIYLELDDENYHKANIIGMGIYDGKYSYYLTEEDIIKNKSIFNNKIISYDVKKVKVALNKHGISIKYAFDTLIAAYLLELNVKEDIAYLLNQVGYDIPFYEKIVSKKNKIEEKEIVNAILLKAKYIFETRKQYEENLIKNNMNSLYYDIELPLIDVLSRMEISGVYFNKSEIVSLKSQIEVKIENISNDIFNMAGVKFNLSSPKQLSEILYDKLFIPKLKKGKKENSTSQIILSKLIDVHPIIPKILEYRNLNKIYTTYLDNLSNYVMEDNKIHTIFKQNITRTGRLSSIDPNLQNIPIRSEEGRKIRKAFIPSKDSVILSADYSQIELRILAHISNCNNLVEAFNEQKDIHTTIAADIYGIADEKVTKNMRRTAKAVIFGIVYGISGYGLGENLDISMIEAQKFINKYLELYPEVKNYMTNIVIQAKEDGYVTTLFGRKRTIEELNNSNRMIQNSGQRMALNTPIQGTSADIIKKAMIEVDKQFKKSKLNSKMILQVHDELIFDTLKSEIKEVKRIVTEVMENIVKLNVPLKIEIDYGDNWYET